MTPEGWSFSVVFHLVVHIFPAIEGVAYIPPLTA